MSYTPRGAVKVILDAMAEQAPTLEWSTQELADIAKIDKRQVSTTLKTAGKNGAVFSQRRGLPTFYSLTPFPSTDEPVEPVPFNGRRWLDGDVDLYGLLETDDGAHRIPADKIPALMQLLGSVPA